MQEIKIRKAYLIAGILALLAFSMFFFAQEPATSNNREETADGIVPAQDFSLQTTTGETIRLSQFRGSVVILQAMASWCPSCKLQAQQIMPVYEKHAKDGLVVISLDVQPERSSLQDLKNFKTSFGGGWRFGFYPEFIGQYGIRSLDSTVVIDRNGNIAYRDDTITTTDKLEEQMQGLL